MRARKRPSFTKEGDAHAAPALASVPICPRDDCDARPGGDACRSRERLRPRGHHRRRQPADQRPGQRDPLCRRLCRRHRLHRRQLHRADSGGRGTAVPRANAAAINASNGSILPWNPGTDAAVLALAASADGNTIYLGGDFVVVGGQTRRHIAAVDGAGTSPTRWAPDAGGGRVKAISVAAGKVFIGGYFTNINAIPRNKLGAIDASTGDVLPWDAPVTHSTANPYVAALTLTTDGSGLLVGGKFDAVQAVSPRNAAELSVDDATLLPWKPRARLVLAIAVTGSSPPLSRRCRQGRLHHVLRVGQPALERRHGRKRAGARGLVERPLRRGPFREGCRRRPQEAVCAQPLRRVADELEPGSELAPGGVGARPRPRQCRGRWRLHPDCREEPGGIRPAHRRHALTRSGPPRRSARASLRAAGSVRAGPGRGCAAIEEDAPCLRPVDGWPARNGTGRAMKLSSVVHTTETRRP